MTASEMQYGQSEEITSLAQALLKVQAGLTPAVKDASNSYSKSQYATLTSVMESCRKLLADNGLVIVQFPCPASGTANGAYQLSLTTKLIHAETGQWIASTMSIPLEKNTAQALGSAITYGRRYAISAMIGIVTADDDGEAASRPRQDNSSQAGHGYTTNTYANRGTARTYANRGTARDANHGNSQAGQSSKPQKMARIDNLPPILNINYEEKTDENGEVWIIATEAVPGASEAARDKLQEIGFKWSDRSGCWWLAG